MDKEWFPVTYDKIKAHFALCIMSQVKKSIIQMYWSKISARVTQYLHRLCRVRDFWLYHVTSYCRNETADKNDRMQKIQNVVNYLNHKFDQLYTPEKDVSIDESLMKFKG